MLGIGFSEMVLIAGIALVVIGPEKFPDFAKLVIRTIRDLRGYVDDIKEEVSKELKPIKKEMDTLSRIDPEKYIDSLTSEAPKSKPAASGVHAEDKKVMDEAAAYGEDPYGWQEGEESDYRADKGAYPEETVGYGEVTEATEEVQVSKDTGEVSAGEDADEVRTEDAAPSEASEDSEFEALNDSVNSDSSGEPDVWTGR